MRRGALGRGSPRRRWPSRRSPLGQAGFVVAHVRVRALPAGTVAGAGGTGARDAGTVGAALSVVGHQVLDSAGAKANAHRGSQPAALVAWTLTCRTDQVGGPVSWSWAPATTGGLLAPLGFNARLSRYTRRRGGAKRQSADGRICRAQGGGSPRVAAMRVRDFRNCARRGRVYPILLIELTVTRSCAAHPAAAPGGRSTELAGRSLPASCGRMPARSAGRYLAWSVAGDWRGAACDHRRIVG